MLGTTIEETASYPPLSTPQCISWYTIAELPSSPSLHCITSARQSAGAQYCAVVASMCYRCRVGVGLTPHQFRVSRAPMMGQQCVSAASVLRRVRVGLASVSRQCRASIASRLRLVRVGVASGPRWDASCRVVPRQSSAISLCPSAGSPERGVEYARIQLTVRISHFAFVASFSTYLR